MHTKHVALCINRSPSLATSVGFGSSAEVAAASDIPKFTYYFHVLAEVGADVNDDRLGDDL